MTQQSELEKTQAELAKLQLERERFKFAQQQKRQKVVDNLGVGAVSVGKATGRAVGGVALLTIGAIVGALVAVVVWGTYNVLQEFSSYSPEVSTMVRIGSSLGRQHYNYPWAAIIGAAAWLVAFWDYRRSRK